MIEKYIAEFLYSSIFLIYSLLLETNIYNNKIISIISNDNKLGSNSNKICTYMQQRSFSHFKCYLAFCIAGTEKSYTDAC